jgi:4-amino-4-deoxy-L-arabinose transferase-like glycosyltransferase
VIPASPAPPRDVPFPRPSRRFVIALAVVTAAAFVLRLAFVWFSRKGVCGADVLIDGCPGDAWVYHNSANLLADGKGFISPADWIYRDVRYPSADHPPLFFGILAGFSFVGLDSWFAHHVVVVLMGTITVFVTGLATREVFGARAGLVAAVLIALNPNVWINDGNVLSETPAILCMVLVMWTGYRLWYRPTYTPAILLGLAIGASMLIRPESGMLVLLVAAPMALLRRDAPWRDRILRLVACGGVAFLVVLPWVGYNLTRFNRPVTLSTGFGITLANTNCDITYYGDRLGYWSPECIPEIERPAGWDQSDDERFLRTTGLDYIRAHETRFPVVVAARLGRMWNLYRPLQQADLDYFEGRPVWANHVALVVYYPMVVLAVYGAVVTRRRRIPLLPVLAPVVMVTVSAVITFGHARYRAPAEAALCVLAAVALTNLFDASRSDAGRRVRDASSDEASPSDESVGTGAIDRA